MNSPYSKCSTANRGRNSVGKAMSRSMRDRFQYGMLICLVVSPASSAFAHRPYERAVGTFERNDRTTISIVRHYVDGIVAADPVSIQFRLPGGTEVAKTP